MTSVTTSSEAGGTAITNSEPHPAGCDVVEGPHHAGGACQHLEDRATDDVPSPGLPAAALSDAQVQGLTELLDGRFAAAKNLVRDTIREMDLRPVQFMTTAEQREYTVSVLQGFAERGLEVGLLDLENPDPGGAVTAIEMIGSIDLSLMVKTGVQWGLYGGAIAQLGTRHHHEKYLADARALRTLGCFAMTETGHGSDVMSIRTTATFDPDTDELVINTPDLSARKDYIGNAALHARTAVVFAQLVVGDQQHGVHAVLVPIRDSRGARPGITLSDCGRKGGLNGIDNGRIWFDHVRVPRTGLLDRYGSLDKDGNYSSPIDNPKRRFFTMVGTLVRGRVSVAGAALNATKSALTIAVRYALLRRQFERAEGEPEVLLLDYATHQRRLLPPLATAYALTFAQNALVAEVQDLAETPDAPDERLRNLETWAAGLKAIATDYANQTVQTCREACGGAGFLSENLLVQLRSDCDVFATFEGDNVVLLQLVGKGLLTGYRHHFGELDSLGVARFVTERFVSSLVERVNAGGIISGITGALDRKDAEGSLLDRDWHIGLFADRAEHSLETVADRLRARSKTSPQFEAFSACQHHLLIAARAHVHTQVLNSFVAAIEHCQDPELRAVLDTVCDLYVLSNIEQDRAWFLEHGRLTPQKSKAVTAAVDKLCSALRPHVAELVDAFAIPDNAVGAQMLRDNAE